MINHHNLPVQLCNYKFCDLIKFKKCVREYDKILWYESSQIRFLFFIIVEKIFLPHLKTFLNTREVTL